MSPATVFIQVSRCSLFSKMQYLIKYHRLYDVNGHLFIIGAIKTEIGRHSDLWWRLFMAPILLLFFTDVDSGAQTSLHCALQEGLEPLSGRYFSSCAVRNVPAKARDDAVAKKLWEVSERLVGLA